MIREGPCIVTTWVHKNGVIGMIYPPYPKIQIGSKLRHMVLHFILATVPRV